MATSKKRKRTRTPTEDFLPGSSALRQTLFTTALKLGRTKLWMALVLFYVFARQGAEHLGEGITPSFWLFILATVGPVTYILAQAHVDGKRLEAKAAIIKAREAKTGGTGGGK